MSLPLNCSAMSASSTAIVDAEKLRQRADIDDVLEQLTLARILVAGVGQLGQRHADDIDVVPELRRRHRSRGIVEQVAARLDRGDVLVPGLRVHGDHEVDAAAPPEMAVAGHAHLVPGRQALDVRREDVARGDRHAHADDRAREQPVGARRSRPVHVGELHDEVVDPFEAARPAERPAPGRDRRWGSVLADRFGFRSRASRPTGAAQALSACGSPGCMAMLISDFCMSQAPVGQRSAHSPQWRHTSSSLTMTRPVLSASET